MAYIIDSYSKYEDNSGVEFVFQVRDMWFCIRRIELDWGQPVRDYRIEDYEPDFKIYESFEEAKQFADELMKLDGRFVF